MIQPNKFRTMMVLAAIVTLLSFTVALAAGLSGYINIRGEQVDGPDVLYLQASPTPVPSHAVAATEEPDYFTLVSNIQNSTPDEHLVLTSYITADGYADGQSRPIQITVESYEQLASLVGDDSLLLKIPEGFSFRPGYAVLSCPEDSAYELVSQETTPEGITVTQYRIPEGKAVVSRYGYNVWDENHNIITINMRLETSETDSFFRIEEEDHVEMPAIPGMADALLISRPRDMTLTAHRTSEEPVTLWNIFPYAWENGFPTETYDLVEFEVYTWGDMIRTDWDEATFREIILSMFDK